MCTLTLTAFDKGCNSNGGVELFYLIDKSAREASAVTLSTTAGALTIGGTGGTAYTYKPIQNNTTFTQPITATPDSGTYSYLQTLESTFHNYSAALVELVQQISKGRLEAVVKMRNGTYFYAGIDFTGLQLSGGDGGFTGTGINDPNGHTISLTCESTTLAPTVTFSEFETAFTIN